MHPRPAAGPAEPDNPTPARVFFGTTLAAGYGRKEKSAAADPEQLRLLQLRDRGSLDRPGSHCSL
jgi:hypothetical protein